MSKIILSLSILLTWIISASAQEITAEVYQSSTASAGNVVKIVKDEEKTVPKYEETKYSTTLKDCFIRLSPVASEDHLPSPLQPKSALERRFLEPLGGNIGEFLIEDIKLTMKTKEFKDGAIDAEELGKIRILFSTSFNGTGGLSFIALLTDEQLKMLDQLLAKRKAADGAIADYSKAIKLKPDYADAYYNRGAAKQAKGDLDGAIADFTKAIELKPDYAEAYTNRGNEKGAKGDFDGAISDYDQAIRLAPKFAFAYVGRGLAYYDQGNIDKALIDYDQAIWLDPNLAPAYVDRGNAYQSRGDLEKAIIDYNDAIWLDPNLAPAYVGRGDASTKQGNLNAANADYATASRLRAGQVFAETAKHFINPFLARIYLDPSEARYIAQTASPAPENSVSEASPPPADNRLEERDIVDLLSQKKLQIQTEGVDIQNVYIRIKRMVAFPIRVRIPVSTFFVSGNKSSQNMIATEEREVTLNSDKWESFIVLTACANRQRHIPQGSDSFRILRSPNQKELATLMLALQKAHVDYETRQAAVWIVTDDANYNDLGILVGSRNGEGSFRVINEDGAARAMKICMESGINIKNKSIWDDRKRIFQGIKDVELKKWLQQAALLPWSPTVVDTAPARPDHPIPTPTPKPAQPPRSVTAKVFGTVHSCRN